MKALIFLHWRGLVFFESNLIGIWSFYLIIFCDWFTLSTIHEQDQIHGLVARCCMSHETYCLVHFVKLVNYSILLSCLVLSITFRLNVIGIYVLFEYISDYGPWKNSILFSFRAAILPLLGVREESRSYRAPRIGDHVISHHMKWAFYGATIASFDRETMSYTVNWDDGDPTGKVQSYKVECKL